MSKYLLFALPLALRGVSAHGFVEAWTVNGQRKDGFQPSYPPRFPNSAERPTDNANHEWADYKSPIVACGGMSAGTGLETWDVDAGSAITAHWESWPDSHVGPVIEYMAACPATGCDGVDAASLSWFKIAEESWDGSKWAGYKVFETKDWSFNVPADLQAGPYLVRHEIIALHTVNEDGSKEPQVYPVCIQVNVISEGSAVPLPEELTTFPEAYTINTDFEEVNIYYHPDFDFADFVAPGPPVASLAGTGTGSSPAPSPSSAASVEPAPSASAPSSAATPLDPTAAPVLVGSPSDTAAAPSDTEQAASSIPVDPAAGSSASAAPSAPGGGRGNGYCRGGSRQRGAGRPSQSSSAVSSAAAEASASIAPVVEPSAVVDASAAVDASLTTDAAVPVDTATAEDAAASAEDAAASVPADEYVYKRRNTPAGAHHRRSRAVRRTL